MTEWSQVPAVARPLTEPEPQPVLAPLTNSAIFLVLTINAGGEEVVRDLLSDWTGLQRAVGFRAPGPPLGVAWSTDVVATSSASMLFAFRRTKPPPGAGVKIHA